MLWGCKTSDNRLLCKLVFEYNAIFQEMLKCRSCDFLRKYLPIIEEQTGRQLMLQYKRLFEPFALR